MVVFDFGRNNKIDFPVYGLDTLTSILDRLSSTLNTKPKYLYFPGGMPSIDEIKSHTIKVEDLLSVIRNTPRVNKLVDYLNDKIQQQGLSWATDIFTPFITFNNKLESSDSNIRGTLILSLENSIMPVVDAEYAEIKRLSIVAGIPPPAREPFDIQKIWDNRSTYIKNWNINILERNKGSKTLVKQFKAFASIKTPILYTDIDLDSVTLKFSLNIGVTYGSLMEVFNYMVTNPNIPFISFDNYFKILKDFVPANDWSTTTDTAIILRILTSPIGKSRRYIDVWIGPTETNDLRVEVELDVTKPTVSTDEIVERILSSLPSLNATPGVVNESTINGAFNLPLTSVNKYILSDLVLNNTLFSEFITIKENDKATKAQKTGLYILFNHDNTGPISSVVTEQYVTEQTPQSLRRDETHFPMGSSFVRIKISRARDIKSAREFREIFSRLMVIYDQQKSDIMKEYKKYISTFTIEKPPKSFRSKRSTLQDIDGDVFVEYYSRWCKEEKQPTIVNDEEAAAADAKGLQVMVYPRPDAGFKQRNYICEKKGFPWPGVQKNNTASVVDFPYVPCCFASPQTNIAKYKKYFGTAEEKDETERGQQDLYEPLKIVPPNKFGKLVANIYKLFRIIDPDNGYQYLRVGSHRTKSSFLDCIITALEITDISYITDTDDRNDRLAEVRDDLATAEFAAVCRQEMYDSTIDEIISQIKDPNIYLDPRKFVSLLETVYNCKIYIFTKTDPDGEMALPHHSQAYYARDRHVRSIAIYEHMGGEADKAEYPQCELITKWDGSHSEDSLQLNFSPNNPITQSLLVVQNKLRLSYALDKKIPLSDFPITDFMLTHPPKKSIISVLGQGIDSYGKCRMFLVKVKKITLTLLTSPMPPFAVPEIGLESIRRIGLSDALTAASIMGIPISSQIVQRGVTVEVRGIIGSDITVIIPVTDSSPARGIPQFDTSPEYPLSASSDLEEYNRSKKLARYLTQYMFWMYSNYISDDESITDESIAEFGDEKIEIDPTYTYGSLSGILSTDSGVVSNTGRLVVHSNEAVMRLLFVLRLQCRHHEKDVRAYKDKSNVPSFYEDLADLDTYPGQVILSGSDSVQKWIDDQRYEGKLQKSIIVYTKSDDNVTTVYDTDKAIIDFSESKVKSISSAKIVPGMPYFMLNSLIGSDVYLAQNAMSLETAVYSAKTWYTEHYNPGLNVKHNTVPAFDLYSYTNSRDITLHRIAGDPESDIKILGYIVGVTTMYTVLLPL